METLDLLRVRRLSLARAGLLNPAWTSLPTRVGGGRCRALRGAQAILDRFGYLQLDTVSVAGARSHVLVLLSRLHGFPPELGEALLRPGRSVFEYWGHEASWMPMELYPAFEFRRRAFREHPWWGDVLGAHGDVAERLLARIRDEGALRSADMEGRGSRGWWNLKVARKVAAALWASGDLAIAERSSFLRRFDLTERVIPSELRERPLALEESLDILLERALNGHGWATTATLGRTWRLRGLSGPVRSALERLVEKGIVGRCALVEPSGRRTAGWCRPQDLELAERLVRARPRGEEGVLLSPFDPLLWERDRVERHFGFAYRIQIFTPAARRLHGYFCLPVLAGERLIGRVDLQARRATGTLCVSSAHFESARPKAADREALRRALARHATALGLRLSR